MLTAKSAWQEYLGHIPSLPLPLWNSILNNTLWFWSRKGRIWENLYCHLAPQKATFVIDLWVSPLRNTLYVCFYKQKNKKIKNKSYCTPSRFWRRICQTSCDSSTAPLLFRHLRRANGAAKEQARQPVLIWQAPRGWTFPAGGLKSMQLKQRGQQPCTEISRVPAKEQHAIDNEGWDTTKTSLLGWPKAIYSSLIFDMSKARSCHPNCFIFLSLIQNNAPSRDLYPRGRSCSFTQAGAKPSVQQAGGPPCWAHPLHHFTAVQTKVPWEWGALGPRDPAALCNHCPIFLSVFTSEYGNSVLHVFPLK